MVRGSNSILANWKSGKIPYIVPAALAGLAAVSLLAYQTVKAASKIEIPTGTQFHLRLNQVLDTVDNRAGDGFAATLESPVKVGQKVAIPTGTQFHGHVTAASPSGRLEKRGFLAVTFDSLQINGKTYRIDTSSHQWLTGSHKKRNWVSIGGGSGVGALIGGLAGGGKGALIGAGAGAGAGTVGAALTGRKNVFLPVETLVTVSLQKPITIEGLRTQ